MKRIFMLATILILVATTVFAATSVVVTGTGKTRNEALRNALDQVIRDASGSFLYSESKSADGVLTDSNVYISTLGFIEKHEILSSTTDENGLVTLQVKAIVNDKINTDVTQIRNGQEPLVNENDIERLSHSQNKLKEAKALLQAMMGDPRMVLLQGYRFHKEGYVVDEMTANNIRGAVLVSVERNKDFWKSYWDLVRTLKTSGGDTVTEGFYGSSAFDEKLGKKPLYYNVPSTPGFAGRINYHDPLRLKENMNGVRVDKSLKGYLAKPISALVRIGTADEFIVLHKNALMMGWPEIHPKDAAGNPKSTLLFGTPNYVWKVPSRYVVRASADGTVYTGGFTPDDNYRWVKYVSQQSGGITPHENKERFEFLSWMGKSPVVSTHSTNVIRIPFNVTDTDEMKRLLEKEIFVSGHFKTDL